MNKKKDNRRIKVAHIVGKWVGGGVESVIMNYYRHIERSKIQFDFICDDDSTNIPYEEIKKLGGNIILIPPYQKIFSYHRELKKILSNGNYKIVHSHINALSVFPLFAAKMANVPVRIAHSHSTTHKSEWKKNLIKQALRPFSKTFSTHYLACTEHAGRWLFGDKTYNNGEVYLLNNAINLDKFAFSETNRKNKRKELNIKEDTIVIGHIGRFVDQKNHVFLIDIFNEVHKKNKNTVLLLIGQGPKVEEIKEKVNKLNLNDSVIFLGQRTDVNELYQTFDIFLLPSLYEGLGMVLIEAQCSGIPCVCSTVVPKVVKILDNLKFLDLTLPAKEWAKNIIEQSKVINRGSHFKECQEKGYDIKIEAKKLYELYVKTMNAGEKQND